MKIAFLGAGMVGRTMALDVAKVHKVCSFDHSEENLKTLQSLNPAIETRKVDLQHYEKYPEWLGSFDLVVTAVPGFMGYKCLEAVIGCGKNVADISFFPEDVLQLDQLAKEKGVTVITDIGVAPGMGNLILGYYNEIMTVKRFECYVGGLPQHPKPPFYYKAPFSPIDVVEEYTRPARFKEKGVIVTKPALTDREIMHFDGVGDLEAFNTDGLRSLLYTMPHIPDMIEKTLRYKGHIDVILTLKEAGYFSEEPVNVSGIHMSPLRFSSALLIDHWKLLPNEEELTVMRVIVEGEKDGKAQRVEYNMLDLFDKTTGLSSMSRTTGYTCTAAANLIINGKFREKGVFPPELVAKQPGCFDFVLQYLSDRGVQWKKK